MTDERMREALERAADFAESMRQIFADPYFTDRYDDAGRCERMRDYLREALSAPEARTEHEWEYGGERYRVRWECAYEIVGWCLSVLSPGGKWYQQVYQEDRAAAAEIAKLAGLVRPGDAS